MELDLWLSIIAIILSITVFLYSRRQFYLATKSDYFKIIFQKQHEFLLKLQINFILLKKEFFDKKITQQQLGVKFMELTVPEMEYFPSSIGDQYTETLRNIKKVEDPVSEIGKLLEHFQLYIDSVLDSPFKVIKSKGRK